MSKTREMGSKDTKGRVSFVMFQVEGDDATLQQGFKAMEQAFQQLGSSSRTYSPPLKTTRVLVRPEANAAVQLELPETEEELLEVPEEESSNGAGESSKPPRVRTYTQPTFLSDLDLGSGPDSFKEYATRKDPKTDNEKYLVASRWLQQFGSVDSATINHIYTCFQAMKWTSQRDVAQPFRNMTKKDSYFLKNGKGWKLTHVGNDSADAIGS